MELTPQVLQAAAAIIGAFAALFVGIYGVVTRPIISRLDSIDARLGRIEADLKVHGERITRLEDRLPPLVHR